MRRLREPDAISICVPTPLSKIKDPDVSYIVAATEAVKRTLRRGQAIVLESTTYPGTTREILLPALESTGPHGGRGLLPRLQPRARRPGQPELRHPEHAEGGRRHHAGLHRVAVALYQPAIDTLVPVSTTEAAELVKLLENTFRSVNIGLVNEMAIVCDKLGVDVWEVIEAAATKPFGFMKFPPGPGLGGHCIPLDPHYLAWKMRGAQLQDALHRPGRRDQHRDAAVLGAQGGRGAERRRARRCNGARVLVLGVAYKRDIDDMRESPALDIIRLLEEQGARVSYPRSVRAAFSRGRARVSLGGARSPRRVAAADCVMIVTDHTAVDYRMIKRHAKLVVDTRNAMPKED